MTHTKRIAELEAELAKLKKEQAEPVEIDDGTTFTPKHGDFYYTVDDDAWTSQQERWLNCDDDVRRLIFGNVFKTHEGIENARQKRLAIVRVTRAIHELNSQVPQINRGRYGMYYDCERQKFICSNCDGSLSARLLPLSASREIAAQIIRDCGDDLKIIFGVE